MPFRTRKQKLAAAQRRFTFSQNYELSYQNSKNNPQISQKKEDGNLEKLLQENKVRPTHIEADYYYIKRDLIKIAIVASFICAVQIILFFVKLRAIIPF